MQLMLASTSSLISAGPQRIAFRRFRRRAVTANPDEQMSLAGAAVAYEDDRLRPFDNRPRRVRGSAAARSSDVARSRTTPASSFLIRGKRASRRRNTARPRHTVASSRTAGGSNKGTPRPSCLLQPAPNGLVSTRTHQTPSTRGNEISGSQPCATGGNKCSHSAMSTRSRSQPVARMNGAGSPDAVSR